MTMVSSVYFVLTTGFEQRRSPGCFFFGFGQSHFFDAICVPIAGINEGVSEGVKAVPGEKPLVLEPIEGRTDEAVDVFVADLVRVLVVSWSPSLEI